MLADFELRLNKSYNFGIILLPKPTSVKYIFFQWATFTVAQ